MNTGDQGQLGARVRRFRRSAGLTQQEAAELAGLSVGALRDIEQGRVLRPRGSTLRRLGAALELARAELAELTREANEGSAVGVRIEVLGPLRVVVRGEPVDLGSEKQSAILGLLALSPNLPVSRNALLDVVWGDHPADRAIDSLHSQVSRLRRRLQPDGPDSDSSGVLVASGGGYQLTVTDGQHDLLTFHQLVAQARCMREEGEPNEACRLFAEAVALWRGEPLAELSALQSHPMVVALVREHRQVVVEYAEIASEVGRYHDVLPLLQQLAELDPVHEAVHAQLMIALAGSGQQAAALNVFDSLRRRLADELGADPGVELTTAYQRVLRQEVSRPDCAPVAAHRQLPPDIVDFSGRTEQLRELRSSPEGDLPALTMIEGMGGVGKTRLAVHLAHRLLAAGHYSDAQLYVDLRGYSTKPPADPAAVLASFLRLFGVPSDQIPPGLDERAAMYRDRMYDKNVLVLLDNAASEDQVLPLLPTGSRNAVLITSRRAMALDGSRTLSLDVFTTEEARELLIRVVGASRVDAEPVAAARVVELCGRLPLAVALVARRLQSRSAWTFAALADRLAQAENRLSELAAGSRRLRAVFDLSYQALCPIEQRMFRLLGLHPGDDFTADSAATLAGLAPGEAQVLDRLVDEHLVIQVTEQRYRLHNLVAEYARSLVMDGESESSRRTALTRLLDFYLHAAARATQLIHSYQEPLELVGAEPKYLPELKDREGAKQWLDGNRANLVTAGTLAAEQGWPVHAWQLTRTLRKYLDLYGCGEADYDWVRVNEAALAAAVAADDSVGAVLTRNQLARAYLNHGRVKDAREQLRLARDFRRDAGHRSFEIDTLLLLAMLSYQVGDFSVSRKYGRSALELAIGHDPHAECVIRAMGGYVLGVLGHYDLALNHLRRGLDLSGQIGDWDGSIYALAGIGDVCRRLGHYSEAIQYLEAALTLTTEEQLIGRLAVPRHRLGKVYRDLGRHRQALENFAEALRVGRLTRDQALVCEALIDFGATHRDTGNLQTAHDLLDQGLRLAISRNQRYQEARALSELGELHDRAGRSALAESQRRRAYDLFEELGAPETPRCATSSRNSGPGGKHLPALPILVPGGSGSFLVFTWVSPLLVKQRHDCSSPVLNNAQTKTEVI
ncbi:BTAD domain-containing putative transcriptional regulator [Amycolatopsis taiwanensis]|uniref:BTAD domain-containing putative transcriptional regulator n=1 Tax=Amycolatopsis taiwanensis TaxID=342230 RepID=UPI0004B4DB66|nr:BTAD domain-containing putative transcriptional regulator [Amycolatopsis taiwanensis]